MARVDRRARQRLNPQEREAGILAAAREAFAAAPYDEVSVAAIAQAAAASEALVYRYFASKAGLYAAVVRDRLDDLAALQMASLDALPPHSGARDQVRAVVEVFLDHVAQTRTAWASPFITAAHEPEQARDLRRRYRGEIATNLAARLRNPSERRARVAIAGFLGFVGAVAQEWAERGCPPDDRTPLVEASLGALMGALGDWGAFREE